MLKLSFATLGLTITLASLLAACGSNSTAPVLAQQHLEAQALRVPAAAQKNLMSGHSKMVQRAAVMLLAIKPDLNPSDLAPAVQRSCLRGADKLTVNGQAISLKAVLDRFGTRYDLSWPAVPVAAGAQACRATVNKTGGLDIAVVGRGGWISVNGAYPAGDPDAPPVDPSRAAAARSGSAYKVGIAILAEDPTLTAPQVAAVLQPLCLKAFDTIGVAGKTFAYGLPAAPATLASCTVEAPSDTDLRVTVTTETGLSSVNGRVPANDPANLDPAAQARNAQIRSGAAYKVSAAVLAEDPTVNSADVAIALQPLCLTAFDQIVVSGKTFAYGLPAAPIGLATCVVEANGEDIKVSVKSVNGSTSVNGQIPLDDPRNLEPGVQGPNSAARSLSAFKLATALLAEDPALSAAQVAAALQPLCLTAFSQISIADRTYSYGLPAVSIGVASCTVAAGGDDIQVTVTSADGRRYLNGQFNP